MYVPMMTFIETELCVGGNAGPSQRQQSSTVSVQEAVMVEKLVVQKCASQDGENN